MNSWNADVELSEQEIRLLKLSKKQKLWSFFRLQRHQILSEDIRKDLQGMYLVSEVGRPASCPERLFLALLLQAAFNVADHEVVALSAVDQRWQMVLDCLGESEPAFSQGSVFKFRERIREHGLMARLLSNTVAIARESKGFGHKRLRTLFDSSPLFGAGRVEDTFNLLGRAIAQLVEVSSDESGQEASEIAAQLDITVFGSSSVKQSLDIDWRLPESRLDALNSLVDQFRRIEDWLENTFGAQKLEKPPLSTHLDTVRKILDENTEPDPTSSGDKRKARIRPRIGAPDRTISLSDKEMRHGRKSKSKGFSGYKRHVAVDADVSGLICSVKILRGNSSEHEGAEPLLQSLTESSFQIQELHIDRGYLPALAVRALHDNNCTVISKPPTPVKGERYDKSDFLVDFSQKTITCPAGQTMPIALGKKSSRYPKKTCQNCAQKSSCISEGNKYGKVIRLHSQEKWYREMSAELSTSIGRKKRRERIPVEHALARVGAIQGKRARYRGLEKNQFDLERVAVINNFYVLERLAA